MDNQPLPVEDQSIKQGIQENRRKSSASSKTFNEKSRKMTKPQIFSPGDLVFIRGGKSKNSPRELYIVEEKIDDYYMTRRFSNRLRNRRYKAMSEELIAAPSSNATNSMSDDDTVDGKENQLHSNEGTDTQQKLSKAGRPIRKATEKAHNILKIAPKSPKPYLHRYGWVEEDQFQDEDFYFFPTVSGYHPEHPNSQEDSDRTHSSRTLSSINESDSDNIDSDRAGFKGGHSGHVPRAPTF